MKSGPKATATAASLRRFKQRLTQSQPGCPLLRPGEVAHLVALAELPPSRASPSTSVTCAPCSIASSDAVSPARPPPTTTTLCPCGALSRMPPPSEELMATPTAVRTRARVSKHSWKARRGEARGETQAAAARRCARETAAARPALSETQATA